MGFFFGGGGSAGGGGIFGPGIFWCFDFCPHTIIHVIAVVYKFFFALLINNIKTTVKKKSKKLIECIKWQESWIARNKQKYVCLCPSVGPAIKDELKFVLKDHKSVMENLS